MTITLWRAPPVVAVLLAAAVATAVPAQEFTYWGSVGMASGDYIFTDRTESASFLNGVTVRSGRLSFSVSMPLIYQNSSAITFIAGTAIPTGGPDAGSVRQREPGQSVPMGPGRRGTGGQGGQSRATLSVLQVDVLPDETAVVAEPGDYELHAGDPIMQASADVYTGTGGVRSLTVNGFAKAPVADVESGVGTGEWDGGGGLSLALGSGETFVFADASYWMLGDMVDLPLNDIFVYGLSLGRSLGAGRWSVMASLSGASAVIDNADAPLSAGVGVSLATSRRQGLSAGVSFGLSESSPDLSGYIGWRVSTPTP